MATKIGTVIDGKYEILSEIGRGGMSYVYLAQDKRLTKSWAVKEIRTRGNSKDEGVINSLIAEAYLMKDLDYPDVPSIVDMIETGETMYIIMDYVEGEPLNEVLERDGSQQMEKVLEWSIQLCGVLRYLHTQDPPIIYRDLKPANIRLKPDGKIKMLDFGTACRYKNGKLIDTVAKGKLVKAVAMGTPGYAPPEQHDLGSTDTRADIYAFGMTMHHLLTGIDPQSKDYVYIPIRQYSSLKVKEDTKETREVLEGLEEIINICTELNPDDRYQSCDELMWYLEHPREVGKKARDRKKRRRRMFLISAVATVAMLLIGISGQLLRIRENNNNYDILLDDEGKGNQNPKNLLEDRIEACLKAIDLYGSRPRAYLKLLEIYDEDNKFEIEESEQFTKVYDEHQKELKQEFEDNRDELKEMLKEENNAADTYLDLLYKAGELYFYKYDDGSSVITTGISQSYPYFQTIEESEMKDFKYYKVSQSRCRICEFYSQYVNDISNVKEPKEEDYKELLDSIEECLVNIEEYSKSDDDDSSAKYRGLLMYREMQNLLNDYRNGFVVTGIEESKVLGILTKIHDRAEQIIVANQEGETGKIKEIIKASHTEYTENIQRAYRIAEERGQ